MFPELGSDVKFGVITMYFLWRGYWLLIYLYIYTHVFLSPNTKRFPYTCNKHHLEQLYYYIYMYIGGIYHLEEVLEINVNHFYNQRNILPNIGFWSFPINQTNTLHPKVSLLLLRGHIFGSPIAFQSQWSNAKESKKVHVDRGSWRGLGDP